MIINTIGTNGKSAKMFFTLLIERNVKQIVDIRLYPASRFGGFSNENKSGNNLGYLAREIANISYVHLPELAPSVEMLKQYKKSAFSWDDYAEKYNGLIKNRRADEKAIGVVNHNSVLLCSEAESDFCHRRLAAEYLQRAWTNVNIVHI